MGETISTTRELMIQQNDANVSWFDTFEHCYGITEAETDRLKPLDDIQTDKYAQQSHAVCEIFNNEINKLVYERRTSFKQFRMEGLETKEDAYEVISSCQYVLNKVYDIHTQKAVSVNLRHKWGKEKLYVKIENDKKATTRKSLWKKSKRIGEGWSISIVYGSPRILLMVEFLKVNFFEELESRSQKRKTNKNEESNGGQEKTKNGENKAEKDNLGKKRAPG